MGGRSGGTTTTTTTTTTTPTTSAIATMAAKTPPGKENCWLNGARSGAPQGQRGGV